MRNQKRILREAEALVFHSRGLVGGNQPMIDHFERTAAMWSTLLGVEVTREQVVHCLSAESLSALQMGEDRARHVDMACYAQMLELMDAQRPVRVTDDPMDVQRQREATEKAAAHIEDLARHADPFQAAEEYRNG